MVRQTRRGSKQEHHDFQGNYSIAKREELFPPREVFSQATANRQRVSEHLSQLTSL